jgi:hypothetical protein
MAVAHPLLMDNPQFHSKLDYSYTNKTIVWTPSCITSMSGRCG